MIKDRIRRIVLRSAEKYLIDNGMDTVNPDFDIEIPKNEKFGDYSTNVALVLPKKRVKVPETLPLGLWGLWSLKADDF